MSSSLQRSSDDNTDLKGDNTIQVSGENGGSPIDDKYDSADQRWGNTISDERDMARLGKKQEFKRNFSFLSALGFVSVYMATWEFVLVSLSVGFTNGGYAGLFWCFLTTVTCYATIVLSLAEMESMAPTAGGQYHWVSEFAPPRYQRILSYASGWMSTLGWLSSVASSTFIVTTQIEAMINVTNPDYAFERWQYTLIMIAFTVITIFFNTWGAPVLPSLETFCLFGHVIGFFVIMIPLVVLCPKNSASDVFLDFQDTSGYNNMGAAYLISQVYVMYCNLGSDSVVHISEEVENASLTVPRVMIWSYCGNVLLGIGMLITMLFCLGPLEDTVGSCTLDRGSGTTDVEPAQRGYSLSSTLQQHWQSVLVNRSERHSFPADLHGQHHCACDLCERDLCIRA